MVARSASHPTRPEERRCGADGRARDPPRSGARRHRRDGNPAVHVVVLPSHLPVDPSIALGVGGHEAREKDMVPVDSTRIGVDIPESGRPRSRRVRSHPRPDRNSRDRLAALPGWPDQHCPKRRRPFALTNWRPTCQGSQPTGLAPFVLAPPLGTSGAPRTGGSRRHQTAQPPPRTPRTGRHRLGTAGPLAPRPAA